MYSLLDQLLPPEPMRRLLMSASELLDTHPGQLLELADEALAACREAGDAPGQLQAAYWRALALRFLGDCAAAIETLHAARQLATATEDREGMVLIQLGYGRVSTATGLYDAALEFLTRAARLARAALPPDHPVLLDIERGFCILKSRVGHHVEAVQEYLELAERYLERDQLRDAAYCFNNAGNNCSRMLDYEQALRCYARAEALIRQSGDWPLLLAVLRSNRATPLRALGRDDEALRGLLESLPVLMLAGQRSSEIDTRLKLGRLYAESGDVAGGELLLRRALELADESGFTPLRMEIHEELARCGKQRGDYAGALEHTEAAIALRGDMSIKEAADRLERASTLRELERALQAVDDERSRRIEAEASNSQLKLLADALAESSRQQNRLVEALRRESQTDALTGVANRRQLEARLTEEHARARRYGRPLSLLFIDIDHFKRINDRHSHLVGDSVLRALAALAVDVLRQNDLIGRYGGEEFVVLLPETAAAGARLVGDKLRLTVSGYHWDAIAPGLAVTISIGVAELAPDEAMEPWLGRGDAALYRAKQGGRNRVELA
ncbi:tetratricopeptide repeat-containing diguanylate cyclase [Chitinimonas koreensis]|uniref:tetratricopeptide repeat-containing diguanylate cyclase n=1 Tax=Chitinimonas koreensis TaxID=356302 RepID=UPI000685F5FF|nr:GGDEF domain-containing protein [Chitinimonas koreensis]QNM97594.1 GGDEF domain-containing protein [Chitinimonas koreensis]